MIIYDNGGVCRSRATAANETAGRTDNQEVGVDNSVVPNARSASGACINRGAADIFEAPPVA